MAQTITEEQKKKVYDDLATIMINAVEFQILPLKEIQKSSQYILENLDAVKNEEELIHFLEELGKKWDMYAGVYLKIKDQKIQTADQEKIAALQEKLANLSAVTN